MLADIYEFEGAHGIGERFTLSDDIAGRPVANRPYKIRLADGRIVEGITGDKGETSLSRQDIARDLKLLRQNHNEG
ncbi:hypothetical protein ACVBGC_11215 [Burkholderia stagnalis]